jgi:hypothetical protein
MAPQIDLRKTQTVPPPPAAGSFNLTADPNGLPFRRGDLIMPEDTKAYLRQLGWQDGDPLPGNLPKLLADARQDIEAEVKTAATQVVAPNTPPTKIPLVDISDLTPARRAEIQAALQDAKGHAASHAALLEHQRQVASYQVPGADPSVNQVIAEVASQTLAQPEVVVTREPPPQPAAQQPPDTPSDKPPDAVAPLHECPRCLLDLRLPYNVTVTDEDKYAFIAACLGKKQFTKTYALLGGKVLVTFRDLSSQDQDTALLQLRYDAEQKHLASTQEWWSQYALYHLVLGLQRLVLNDQLEYEATGTRLADIPWDPKEQSTAFPDLASWIFANVLNTETLRSIVGRAHRDFENLKELLQKRAPEENFWQGIASRT